MLLCVQTSGREPVAGSQESTSSEVNKMRQLEQLKLAAESSPSPSLSTFRFAYGTAAPVKFSNKAARKHGHVDDKEEDEDEEDYEEMRHLKERGLVSGRLT